MKKLLPILVILMLFVAGGTSYYAYSLYSGDKKGKDVNKTTSEITEEPQQHLKGWQQIDMYAGSTSEKTSEFKVPKEVNKVKITWKMSASNTTDMMFINLKDSRTSSEIIKGTEFNGLGVIGKARYEKEVILDSLQKGEYYFLDVDAFVDMWEIVIEGLYE